MFEIDNLKESNIFLNTLIDNVTSAIFILDDGLRIRSVNSVFKALFDKPEMEVIGEVCGNAVNCEFAVSQKKVCGETIYCCDCQFREDVTKTFSGENEIYKKIWNKKFVINKKVEKMTVQYTTRKISFGGEQLVLVIVDDITEIENKNKKLKELNDLKNFFIGMTAHDLRNPLSIIKSYAQIILEYDRENINDEDAGFVEVIQNQADFVLGLIDDILDISKLETGNFTINASNNNYGDLIYSAVENNKIIAEKKNIEIECNVGRDSLILNIDNNKIKQVINNFISNAIKYSESGTKVSIYIETKGDYIITTISDHGLGIPEVEQGNLFQPFKKTSVCPTGKEKSTGLGLYITKKIIEVHGGEVGVRSKIGVGSEFYFTLPIK